MIQVQGPKAVRGLPPPTPQMGEPRWMAWIYINVVSTGEGESAMNDSHGEYR